MQGIIPMQHNEDSMAEECIGETILASIAHFGCVHGTISTFHLVSLITTPLETQHFIQKALVAASDVVPIAHVGNPKCVLIWQFPEGNGTSHEQFFLQWDRPDRAPEVGNCAIGWSLSTTVNSPWKKKK
jgi:hypothetical protein